MGDVTTAPSGDVGEYGPTPAATTPAGPVTRYTSTPAVVAAH
jgi:hypothetical protein